MGRVEGDVIKDTNNKYFKMVRVQFNGGFLWRNDQIWMNNICIKIVGMGSGNVI
jgi:hypothetical protein